MHPYPLRSRVHSGPQPTPAPSATSKGKRKAPASLRIQVPKKTARPTRCLVATLGDQKQLSPAQASTQRDPASPAVAGLENWTNRLAEQQPSDELSPLMSCRLNSAVWPSTAALYSLYDNLLVHYKDHRGALPQPPDTLPAAGSQPAFFLPASPMFPSGYSPLWPSTSRPFGDAPARCNALRSPQWPFTPAMHAPWLGDPVSADNNLKASPAPSSSVAAQQMISPSAPQEPSHNQGRESIKSAERSQATPMAMQNDQSTQASRLPATEKLKARSVAEQYAETAAHLPHFGAEAMRILHATSNFRHRPTSRQQVQQRWPTWPRQEQEAIFSSRPWAHFAWLALGAMADHRLALSKFTHADNRIFFRQLRAYFIAGGGPGLAAYLDYEHQYEPWWYRNAREAALSHPVILELAEEWHAEGVKFDYDVVRTMTLDDGRFMRIANALPKWGNQALQLLFRYDDTLSKSVNVRSKEMWHAWPREHQQLVFGARPSMQFMWLALGAVLEEGLARDKLFPHDIDFFRQAHAYFIVGGSSALAAYLDLRQTSKSSSRARQRILQHPVIKALAARWQSEGVWLADFDCD